MNGSIIADSTTLKYIEKLNYNLAKSNIKFTSIIILTYNKLNYTKLCIESIRKFTPKDCYEIIVVDNNSTDDTVKWLKKQIDLKVIYNKQNNGFPKGCNQGIEISKGENILLLNNDTIVTPNWLENLNEALYSSDDIGVVGAISNSCSNYQQVQVNYNNIEDMISFAEKNNTLNKRTWDQRTRLIGFCYMIKKEILDKVGLLDEIFSPGNFEDDDLSFRIIQEGYKLLLCNNVFIHHFGSISFGASPQFYELYQANRKKFIDKWGFDNTYSCNIRFDIIDTIKRNLDEEFNILEVGCGTGSTLLQIKNIYKNANIYGIEICEDPGNIAKCLLNTTIGNIETLSLDYENSYFDYIIFGDVIEHLIDPWSVLVKMKKYLKPDGAILASIPNIMHVSIIKSLILGRFHYEDAGILDKTHLRFFTLAEINEMFNTSEYEVKSISANVIGLSTEDTNLINTLCSMSNESLRQQYMSYQYIIVAQNKLDIDKYDNKDKENLIFKLMKIDNDIDKEESLKFIFEMNEKYKSYFEESIVYLINSATLNKEKVMTIIGKEAKNKGLQKLSSLLGVI